MHFSSVLHHIIMKSLSTIFFFFIYSLCNAQSHHILHKIQSQIDELMEGKLEKDSTSIIRFGLDSLSNLAVYSTLKTEEKSFNPLLLERIKPYKNDLDKSLIYTLYYYRDIISGKTFSNSEIEYKYSFPNYYAPSHYRGGINAFLKTIYAELNKNIEQSNLDQYDWDKPIKFIIDYNGKLNFIKDNNFINLIDTSVIKKWDPEIDFTRVSTYYQTTLLNKEEYIKSNTFSFELMDREIVFPELFHNKLIFINKYHIPKSSESSLVVSFILANKKLWEPHIIKDDLDNASELIQKINNAIFSTPQTFFMDDYRPIRVYFSIKK